MSHHWLQVVNDHYSGWGDQQLVDDLFTFFCTNGTTKRLWKQLADRIGNTQRASKQTKRATKKAFTGSDAVRLILDLGMPKRRYPPANRQPHPLARARAPKVQRQLLQVQALQALALLVSQAPSSRRCPASCPYFASPFLFRTVLGALAVRHGVAAGTQRLSAFWYQKVFMSLSALCCASAAACCWCRVPAACF